MTVVVRAQVAPGQYEVAPEFASSNVSVDQNLTLMETITKVMRDHKLQVSRTHTSFSLSRA